MSAGGISYTCLRNHGKVTLPSVQMWGTNMNILKDPPKSITTRRIDKVGQTMAINNMIDEGANRACEYINLYPRGINPSVSVSYSNYTNNGGQNIINPGYNVSSSSTFSNRIHTNNASLPYKIMRQGAFRPPVQRQENLFPLSRLPRLITSVPSTASFADFTKTAMCKNDPLTDSRREVKQETLNVNCRPTQIFNKVTPISETYEIKNNIKENFNIPVYSGERARDISQTYNIIPHNSIDHDYQNVNVHINPGVTFKTTESSSSDFNSKPYTHEILKGNLNTNISSTFHPLGQLIGDSNIKTKDILHINYNTPHSSYTKNEYVHDNIELDRTVPTYQSSTNKRNINNYKNPILNKSKSLSMNRPTAARSTNINQIGDYNSNNSKSYKLQPTLSINSSFNTNPTRPTLNRSDYGIKENFKTQNSELSSKVSEFAQSRFFH